MGVTRQKDSKQAMNVVDVCLAAKTPSFGL